MNGVEGQEMKLVARCPHCKSIWVCWNWVHAFGGDRVAYEKANPHIKSKDLKDWGHECWFCENVFKTRERVNNGVSYNVLIKSGWVALSEIQIRNQAGDFP